MKVKSNFGRAFLCAVVFLLGGCEWSSSACICAGETFCCDGECADSNECNLNVNDGGVQPDVVPTPDPNLEPVDDVDCLNELRVVYLASWGDGLRVFELKDMAFSRLEPDDVNYELMPSFSGADDVMVQDGRIYIAHTLGITAVNSSTFAQVNVRPGDEVLRGAPQGNYGIASLGFVDGWWLHTHRSVRLFHPNDEALDLTGVDAYYAGASFNFSNDGLNFSLVTHSQGFILVQGNGGDAPALFDLRDENLFGSYLVQDRRAAAFDDDTETLLISAPGKILLLDADESFSPRASRVFSLPADLPAEAKIEGLVAQDGFAYLFVDELVDGNLLKVDLTSSPPSVVLRGEWHLPGVTYDDIRNVDIACGHLVMSSRTDEAALRLFNSYSLVVKPLPLVLEDAPTAMTLTTRSELNMTGDDL